MLQVVTARATDLGGFTVRRLLPQRARRLVGPWCFLDLMGPLDLASGQGMDVPPHPHIGIQTVTWLLEGELLHRDGLGSQAVARPGALNLMTAGRGLAHSEETPAGSRGRLHGVQLWIALPEADRQVVPAFDHHPQRPLAELRGGTARVILGAVAGVQAGGRTFSPLMAAELAIHPGMTLDLPLAAEFEHAVVPLDAPVTADGGAVGVDELGYAAPGRRALSLAAGPGTTARVLLLGGEPFTEPILMWWNFVARTSEEIEAAREDWQAGRRFRAVGGYDRPRLEAPPLLARPAPPGRLA